jgi:hypothetical protein
MTVFRSRLFVACFASTLTAVVVGGAAWALQSPVDGSGVVHACYNPSNGNMHLDVKGSCPTTGQNTPITWSAQGPQGIQGIQGVAGPAGPNATYIAETSHSAPGSPDDQLADVNGVDVLFGCEGIDNTARSAVVTFKSDGTVPGVVSIGDYSTRLVDGQGVPQNNGFSLTGQFDIATTLAVSGGSTQTAFAQGFAVLQQSPTLASQAEQGVWFTFYEDAAIGPLNKPVCNVTGSVVPVGGNRSIPLQRITP